MAPTPPPFPKSATALNPAPALEQLSTHDIDAMRELRVLEERAVNVRKKSQLIDENLLSTEQRIHEEVKAVTTELAELRRRLTDIEEGMRLAHSEISHAATISDVRALEKYLAYWEPLQFVTQAELVRRENLLKEQGSK